MADELEWAILESLLGEPDYDQTPTRLWHNVQIVTHNGGWWMTARGDGWWKHQDLANIPFDILVTKINTPYWREVFGILPPKDPDELIDPPRVRQSHQ